MALLARYGGTGLVVCLCVALPAVALLARGGAVEVVLLCVCAVPAILASRFPYPAAAVSPLPSPRGKQKRDGTVEKHQPNWLSAVMCCWAAQLCLQGWFAGPRPATGPVIARPLEDAQGLIESTRSKAWGAQAARLWRLESQDSAAMHARDDRLLRLPHRILYAHSNPATAGERWLLETAPANGGVSIVLPSLHEHEYIGRTIQSILAETSPLVLREIIVVDDANEVPIITAIPDHLHDHPKLKIVRNEERQGLIRSKQIGGDSATGAFILFLDAHVKPYKHYLSYLLKDLLANERRIAVPAIPILNGTSWEQEGNAVGYKMMFDWALKFNWFEDDNDEVPIMSGGLLAITKQWWQHTGGFDSSMQVWGGENIEQSVKTWMAGGEIVVNRLAKIAHVFRSKFPYPVDSRKVTYNKLQTAHTWFDSWYDVVRGSVGDRQQKPDSAQAKLNRTRIAPGRSFNWYIDRFRPSLRSASLIHTPTFSLRAYNSAACLTVTDTQLGLGACADARAHWTLDGLRPEDVFPESWPSIAPIRTSEGEVADGLECEMSPVCRRRGAFLRHVESDRCMGLLSTYDTKAVTSAHIYLRLGDKCLRDGPERDALKTLGFIPSAVSPAADGVHGRRELDRALWNHVLPRTKTTLTLNATHAAEPTLRFRPPPDNAVWETTLAWGSLCLGLDARGLPAVSLCNAQNPSQRWRLGLTTATPLWPL